MADEKAIQEALAEYRGRWKYKRIPPRGADSAAANTTSVINLGSRRLRVIGGGVRDLAVNSALKVGNAIQSIVGKRALYASLGGYASYLAYTYYDQYMGTQDAASQSAVFEHMNNHAELRQAYAATLEADNPEQMSQIWDNLSAMASSLQGPMYNAWLYVSATFMNKWVSVMIPAYRSAQQALAAHTTMLEQETVATTKAELESPNGVPLDVVRIHIPTLFETKEAQDEAFRIIEDKYANYRNVRAQVLVMQQAPGARFGAFVIRQGTNLADLIGYNKYVALKNAAKAAKGMTKAAFTAAGGALGGFVGAGAAGVVGEQAGEVAGVVGAALEDATGFFSFIQKYAGYMSAKAAEMYANLGPVASPSFISDLRTMSVELTRDVVISTLSVYSDHLTQMSADNVALFREFEHQTSASGYNFTALARFRQLYDQYVPEDIGTITNVLPQHFANLKDAILRKQNRIVSQIAAWNHGIQYIRSHDVSLTDLKDMLFAVGSHTMKVQLAKAYALVGGWGKSLKETALALDNPIGVDDVLRINPSDAANIEQQLRDIPFVKVPGNVLYDAVDSIYRELYVQVTNEVSTRISYSGSFNHVVREVEQWLNYFRQSGKSAQGMRVHADQLLSYLAQLSPRMAVMPMDAISFTKAYALKSFIEHLKRKDKAAAMELVRYFWTGGFGLSLIT